MSALDFSEFGLPLRRYHWQCPMCPYKLAAITEPGRQVLSEFHLNQHVRDERREKAVLSAILARPSEYYETLRLSWEDITFFITRHITLDDHVVYDSTITPDPTTESLSAREWGQTLDRVRTRIANERKQKSSSNEIRYRES
jgi:hypothetical protein